MLCVGEKTPNALLVTSTIDISGNTVLCEMKFCIEPVTLTAEPCVFHMRISQGYMMIQNSEVRSSNSCWGDNCTVNHFS